VKFSRGRDLVTGPDGYRDNDWVIEKGNWEIKNSRWVARQITRSLNHHQSQENGSLVKLSSSALKTSLEN
jgi:hypothetical protein